MSELDEPELDDTYPVFAGYFYVVDGAVIESDIQGTVIDLKADINRTRGDVARVESVTRCDIIGRSRMLTERAK